jgi:hypothetical protein
MTMDTFPIHPTTSVLGKEAGLFAHHLDHLLYLRHTFASLLLQQGESIVYVKEQLGHASIQITVDTYGHLIPGANRAAVDKLDDVPAQPAATPAQPEAASADQRDRASCLE